MGHNRPDAVHLTVEAMKLGLADRDVYYADPLFADVPLAGAALDPSTPRSGGRLIDPAHASLVQRPGDPRAGKALLDPAEARGAARPAAARRRTRRPAWSPTASGNVVAATPSGWSGVVAGDTGVWLGSRLQSFNIWAGHPNCIEPGKRPRITLTPTLVLEGRQAGAGGQRGRRRQPGPDDACSCCSTTSTSASRPPSR